MKYLYPTWHDVETYCMSIYAQLMEDKDFRPDMIISVLWGGAIPTRIFMDIYELDRYDCKPVFASCYKDIGEKGDRVIVTHMFNKQQLKNKKILVIDDIYDTGETMKEVVKSFEEIHSEVRIAALYTRKNGLLMPYYYAQEIDNEWVVFPWEHHEAVRKLGDNND